MKMLRSIVNQGKRIVDLSAFTTRFSTKPEFPFRFRTANNDVRIIGTVIKDSRVLASGTKSFIVRTVGANEKYSNHVIHTKRGESFSVGQRIYLTGKLKSSPITFDNNLLKQSIVRADQVYFLEDEPKDDLNAVRIIAHVASKVTIGTAATYFAVATNFHKSTENGGVEEGVYFHDVIARDEATRQYIQANIKKNDRILVSGRIENRTRTATDGTTKAHTGYIHADEIFTIARRSTSSETVSNDSEQESVHGTA